MYEKSLDGDDLTHQFLMMTIPPVICMKEDLEEDVAPVQGEPSIIPMVHPRSSFLLSYIRPQDSIHISNHHR